ncbi:hypothetical protein BHE74_00006087, partial [Ensete ventricosum]
SSNQLGTGLENFEKKSLTGDESCGRRTAGDGSGLGEQHRTPGSPFSSTSSSNIVRNRSLLAGDGRNRPLSTNFGCRKGHFKGMLFDHVIKNFVIQGGNSQKLEVAGDWILKGKAHSQLATSPKHEAFMLGTLKPNKDSKEFELFITTAPIPDLSDKLIIFGRVIKGEDVVQEIEEVDTDEHYRPKSPVGIVDIALKREV